MITELDELYVIYSNIMDVEDNNFFINEGCNCFIYKYFNNRRIPRTTINKPTNFFNITIRVNAVKDIIKKESFISFCYFLYKDFYLWKDCFKIFTNLYNCLYNNQDFINPYYKDIVDDYLNVYMLSNKLITNYNNILNNYIFDILEAIINKTDLNISMDYILKIKYLVKHCYFKDNNDIDVNEHSKKVIDIRNKISKFLATKINENVNIYDKICILVNNYIIDENIILLWLIDAIR